MVRRLVELGANPNLPIGNIEGPSPLQWVIQQGDKPQMESLLRELGATDEPLYDDKSNDDDPILRIPMVQRVGTFEMHKYDSWQSMVVQVGDIDGFNNVLSALWKHPNVLDVVKYDAVTLLSGTIQPPASPFLLLIKLKDQRWAVGIYSETQLCLMGQEFSVLSGHPVIVCGFHDTAGAADFSLFENGERCIHFESTGEDYQVTTPDDLDYVEFPTIFNSDRHDADWWRNQHTENETVQALLYDLNAYIPVLGFYCSPGYGSHDMQTLAFLRPNEKIRCWAFPEDTLDPENIEAVALVVLKA